MLNTAILGSFVESNRVILVDDGSRDHHMDSFSVFNETGALTGVELK